MGGQRETSYFISKELESQVVKQFPQDYTALLGINPVVWIHERLGRCLELHGHSCNPSPRKLRLDGHKFKTNLSYTDFVSNTNTASNSAQTKRWRKTYKRFRNPWSASISCLQFSTRTLEPPTGSFLEGGILRIFPFSLWTSVVAFEIILEPVQQLQFPRVQF